MVRRMKIITAVNDKATNRVMVTYTGSKVLPFIKVVSTEMYHVTQTIIIIIVNYTKVNYKLNNN